VSSLADVMACPAKLDSLTGGQWDSLLRSARFTRLGGRLHSLVESRGILESIPGNARDVLMGARIYADYMQMIARCELRDLNSLFANAGFPVVLLKGAAYVAAGLPVAAGRGLNDIDILVPGANLDEAEGLLTRAGWHFEDTLTNYDHRYYQEWSHELPPMRHRNSRLELDVHHNLIQPTSRIRLNPDLLFRNLVALEGTVFSILSPADMVLHSATHLFMSDELRGGMRDLVDLHMLCKHFSSQDGDFWEKLAERAAELGLGRPLYYAAAAMQRLLAEPVPDKAWQKIIMDRPGWIIRQVMNRTIDRHLVPSNTAPMHTNYAEQILYLRSHWIRMPPLMLAKHLAYKWWVGFRSKGESH
jgi:hypothetical protein